MKRNLFVVILLALALMIPSACVAPSVAPSITGDGNTTTTTTNVTINNVTVEGNNNHVQVGDNTITSSESEVVTTAATEAAPAPTEAPAVETDPAVCFYMAWHDGWEGDGPERIHTNGVLNRTELENGMSMQASWNKWTETTSVDGYEVPGWFETNNDALMGVGCGNIAYIFGRTSSSELPFWEISYIQLTEDGLLACKDDSGEQGSWDGECASTPVVVKGIPIDDITITDFQNDWNEMMDLMDSWNGTTPTYGTIEGAWTSKK